MSRNPSASTQSALPARSTADPLRSVRGRVEGFSNSRIVPANVGDGEGLARLPGSAVADVRRLRWEHFVEAELVERCEREADGS